MKLLDLYSGAGGAGYGYHLAGFEVTGVDINPQPNYPFEFIQKDALVYLNNHGHKYDAIHASPPCQAGCTLTAGTNAGRVYPQLIPATRKWLDMVGKPWVMENPPGNAPMRADVTLCGEYFGLKVIRHRNFELGGWTMPQPEHKRHRGRVAGWRHGKFYEGPYVAVYGLGGGKGSVKDWQEAMGIFWTSDRKELAEAIPPAYTQFVGFQLMQHLMLEAGMGLEPMT